LGDGWRWSAVPAFHPQAMLAEATGADMTRKKPEPTSGKFALDRDLLPSHVAIIMDGNGRWARRRGLPRIAGHAAAGASVRDVVAAGAELGLKELTLYTFSMQNWTRPRSEVAGLMHLLDQTLRDQIDDMDGDNIRLNAIGRLDRLPKYARSRLDSSIERLSGNTGLRGGVQGRHAAERHRRRHVP